jgi:serine protease Do
MLKEREKNLKPEKKSTTETIINNRKAKKRGSAVLRITLGILIILLILGLFGGKTQFRKWLSFSDQPATVKQGEVKLNQEAPVVIPPSVRAEEDAVVQAVEKATPAVVSVVITKDMPKIQSFFGPPDPFSGDPFSDQFFERFFGSPSRPPDEQAPQGGFGGPSHQQPESGSEKVEIGGGTGFIISEKGLIVTNKHVIEDPQADYTVITNDGREYDAKVLGRDRTNDVAVLRIDPKNPKKGSEVDKMETVVLGNSGEVKIGQTVIAIGNALGEFRNTVSKGIISGLSRQIVAGGGPSGAEQLDQLIQTDAAINQGNSGGPLLNLRGEVIGINVAMAQGAQNIGFAIPIDTIKNVINGVEKTGKISQPYLGVRYQPINKAIQEKNSLPFDYGALVLRGQDPTDLAVIPGSPADKAGIVENDIILEVNGAKVDEKNSLVKLVSSFQVGQEVTLKVWHRGQTSAVKVVLAEAPGS